MNRIGVYVCECGPNIRDAVDMEALVAFSGSLPGVVLSRRHGLLCSAEGQALIATEIVADSLTHVVVAGCTPKEHEACSSKRRTESVSAADGPHPGTMRMGDSGPNRCNRKGKNLDTGGCPAGGLQRGPG
ncbi:MAG: hypothetical protein NTU74_11585 [Deltaproteobacteria bacterium]|nr:hypothetical protein [Deltaproteobacteria bacterium]